MVIPYFTFTFIKDMQLLGVDIVLEQQNYERIIYWVSTFGLLISSCAFFNYSSPKQSIRKGTFALIQLILNCLYIWSYKFSGATEVRFEIVVEVVNIGFITVNVQSMVMLYMGTYFLTILLKGYDFFDYIINRKKIREKRYKTTIGGKEIS
jgi:phosphatidylserine synthase